MLVLDGAGWHTAKDLRIPEGVHLAILPPGVGRVRGVVYASIARK